MAAGLATLKGVMQPGFYPQLEAKTQQLVTGLRDCARAAGIPFTTNHVGGMFGLFFTDEPQVQRYSQALNGHIERFKLFFHGMLEHGVYLAPSAFEAGFVSAAHGEAEIAATLKAAQEVLAGL